MGLREDFRDCFSQHCDRNKKHIEFADWSAASSMNFPRSSILFSEGTKDAAFIAAEISFPGSGTTIQRLITN